MRRISSWYWIRILRTPVVDAVLDGNFLHHAGANAGGEWLNVFFLDFDEVVSQEFFDNFGGHVADIIAVQEHLRGVLRVFHETTSLMVAKENRKKTRK